MGIRVSGLLHDAARGYLRRGPGFGRVALLLVFLAAGTAAGQAADRWITDSFEVTLRTGKSTQQSIVRMLSSGTRVELLEVDEDSGYARVRTRGGAEGWVLSRYLLDEPPARVTQPGIAQQLASSLQARRELEARLREVEQERDELRRRASQAEQTGSNLQSELSEVRRLSSNVIEVDQQNRELRERIAAAEQTLTELQRENERLANRSSREWFVVGAGVVILGMVLGLILPRIRWRRKSSWSDL